MYGKKFKDINLIKRKHVSFKRKNFIATLLFEKKEYSLVKLKAINDSTLKIPYPFNFTNEKDILKGDYKIYKNKLYINLKKKNNYFFFFEKKINLKKIKSVTPKKKIYSKKLNVKIRKKYWGEIAVFYSNKNSCAKLINMKKGAQSSMEFHIYKHESYYILKGDVNLGLRYSRARQKIVRLKKNYSFTMLPGTMHMRMSKVNSIILEMSNKDDDRDSIIVHDGKKYKFNIC